MRVAIYARVSTPDQDPEPQLVRLRQWASSLGHEVKMERSEVASGKLVRRRLQDEIMGEALGRRVDAVACVKVDRWARSLKHLSTSVTGLHDRGAGFYCVDQGLNVVKGDPTAGLTLGILGAVAEWEGAIISERTKDTLQALQAEGKRLGRQPGFRRCGAGGVCQRASGHTGACGEAPVNGMGVFPRVVA